LSLEATVAKQKATIKHLGAEINALMVEIRSLKEKGKLILAEFGQLTISSRKRNNDRPKR
jgi:uncharacterized coiled-coil protein SlyX